MPGITGSGRNIDIGCEASERDIGLGADEFINELSHCSRTEMISHLSFIRPITADDPAGGARCAPAQRIAQTARRLVQLLDVLEQQCLDIVSRTFQETDLQSID